MVSVAVDHQFPATRATGIAHLKSIHYLRGLAALAVALGHAGHYVAHAYQTPWPGGLFPGAGAFGVAIFFAISGYLMAELIKRQDPSDFLLRRLLRIYPPFFIAVALTLLLVPVTYLSTSWTHIFLLPVGRDKTALTVEWTLIHEIFFYVSIFALGALGLVRFIPYVAAGWLVLIIALAFTDIHHPTIGHANLFEAPIMYANAGFAAGLLIPVLISRVQRPALFAAIFACFYAYDYAYHGPLSRMWAGIGSAGLIAAAVLWTPSLPRIVDAALNKLGDWSYGLYLVHVPIQLSALFYLSSVLPVGVCFLLVIVLMLAGGALMGEIDTRLHDIARRIPSTIPPETRVYLVTAFVSLYLAAGIYYAL